jgi:transketolase
LLEVSTIKPIDTEALLASAGKTRRVLTVEEHSVCGGMGGAIAEAVSAHGVAAIEILGIQDRFGESGDYMALLGKHGISAGNIEGSARAMVARGRR